VKSAPLLAGNDERVSMSNQILDLEVLLKVPYVDPEGGFDLSPDGSKIAFAWNRSGQWEIFEVRLDLATSPRQISAGPGAKFSPRYAPDGGRLAYVLDLDGGEVFDIYVYDFSTGVHTNLTPDDPGSIQMNYCWSPDGSQIAFISDRSGHFDTYIMPAEGGPKRLVLGLEGPDIAVKWSPDSRWLAVTSEAESQTFATFILPAGGGQARRIVDEGGPIDVRYADWSPNSTRLAFSSNRMGWKNVGVYTLESGKVEWATDGDGDKVSPRWSPDGKRLIYLHSQQEVTWLGMLYLDDASLKTFSIERGVHYAPRFTPDGDFVFCVYDDPQLPSDVWSLDVQNGTSQQITHSLPSELESAPFIVPEVIRYPGLDGEAIPALLFKPVNDGQLPPAVVIIHGGPSWLFQLTWYPLMQHMVSRGWVVLAPNYRGSTGYGRAWQIANHYEQGNLDTQDVAAGAQFLVKNGLADPQRIAVTGRSHGGYLTMSCLTRFPDLWAAGSAIVPFLNWFTSHANSRQDLQHWDIETMGDPEEYHDLWYERSPFFFLDRVKAPVQLICGENDPRCPASESTNARDKLLELGKQVDFKLYEGEGHGFLKIENVIDSEVRRVEFLAQALENDKSKG
jgi:dipeptidyl aminopeptidase/acylaminoacyl peptidase